MRLILASSSPRRREIFALLGLPFETIAPDFEETLSPHCPAEAEVLDFALGKAQSVAKNNPGGIVIGSDHSLDSRSTRPESNRNIFSTTNSWL